MFRYWHTQKLMVMEIDLIGLPPYGHAKTGWWERGYNQTIVGYMAESFWVHVRTKCVSMLFISAREVSPLLWEMKQHFMQCISWANCMNSKSNTPLSSSSPVALLPNEFLSLPLFHNVSLNLSGSSSTPRNRFYRACCTSSIRRRD